MWIARRNRNAKYLLFNLSAPPLNVDRSTVTRRTTSVSSKERNFRQTDGRTSSLWHLSYLQQRKRHNLLGAKPMTEHPPPTLQTIFTEKIDSQLSCNYIKYRKNTDWVGYLSSLKQKFHFTDLNIWSQRRIGGGGGGGGVKNNIL